MTDDLDADEWTLAERLGMTHRALVTTMSSREYLSWKAYFAYQAQQRELHSA